MLSRSLQNLNDLSFVSLAGEWAMCWVFGTLSHTGHCPLSSATFQIHRFIAFFLSPASPDQRLHLPRMTGPLPYPLCPFGPYVDKKRVVLVVAWAGTEQQPGWQHQRDLVDNDDGRWLLGSSEWLWPCPCRGCNPSVSLPSSVWSTGPLEDRLVFLVFG